MVDLKVNKEFLRGLMNQKREKEHPWLKDEAFIQWWMKKNNASREEVLGYRAGMEASYEAFCAGREIYLEALSNLVESMNNPYLTSIDVDEAMGKAKI